jgi:hypothetical protein
MPTRSSSRSVWAVERVSAQMIAGRTGSPAASSSTAPIIWPEKLTPATASRAPGTRSNSCRVAVQTARHHASASCSALPRGPKSVS